jgi:hypothetical protein
LVPALSILQPAKVATPEEALKGSVVHVSAAPAVPVPAVIVKLIEAEKPVAVFPPASCAVTTGCVPKATPDAELLGLDENTNFVAAPGVTLIAVLTAEVKFGLDAVSV